MVRVRVQSGLRHDHDLRLGKQHQSLQVSQQIIPGGSPIRVARQHLRIELSEQACITQLRFTGSHWLVGCSLHGWQL
ncbi:hypothetical protein D3C76_1748540 [compost metagenome]